MPKKMLEVWTTDEILSLINRIKVPNSVRDYKQGYEDALEEVFNRIKGKRNPREQ